jgi:peptidoglycan/LPS O-acetylase OafA/YrhL
MSRSRPSLSALTSLRFFAAAAVVIFHIVIGRSGDMMQVTGFLTNLAYGGYAAVTFFFILSGFILTYAHAGIGERDPLDIKATTFLKLRIARILPAYLLGLVMALPILFEFLRVVPPIERIVGPVLVVSFLQARYPPLSEFWNYPAWSLSVEALFYASFPLLFGIFTGWPRWRLFLLAYLLVLISTIARSTLTDGLAQHFPLFHLPLFIFGMALGRQFLFGRAASTGLHVSMFLIGLLALIVLFGFRSLPRWTRSDAVLVLVFSLIILGGSRPVGAMAVLCLPSTVLLGEASYSIYILHVPLLLLWDNLGFGLPLWLNLPLYFGLVVAFSILSFRCLETPMRRRIASWRPRKWAAAKTAPSS